MNKAVRWALVGLAIVFLVYALIKSGLIDMGYGRQGGRTFLETLKMMKGSP